MKTILLDGLWGAAWRLRGMRRHLLQAGLGQRGEVKIFSYNSSGLIPLEDLADELAQFIGSDSVCVVAHSMGGLITRLAKYRHPQLRLEVTAFLCVPHRGSMLAHLLPFPGVRQLRPGSALLRELQNQEWLIPTLTVWCPGDLLVLPGSSARWAPASREVCCAVPLHNWPVVAPHFHRVVADFFLDHLAKTSSSASALSPTSAATSDSPVPGSELPLNSRSSL